MKFRKKPVIIEALQFCGGQESAEEIMFWIRENHYYVKYRPHRDEMRAGNGEICQMRDPEHLKIQTLEGDMRAEAGDWIIQGVKGEFYPCKPDIFELTYELA